MEKIGFKYILMVSIELKVNHLQLIAYAIKDLPASDVYRLLMEIKNNVSNFVDKEAIVSINVTANEIIFVYSVLSELPEGVVSGINKEMAELLLKQIMEKLPEPGEEFSKIYAGITGIKENKAIRLAEYLESGTDFLKM